jgi:glycerol-3-phosphate dehydrogenase
MHPDLTYCAAEVLWAVRHEMARTVEDVLSRRTRALLLNAKAAISLAPKVAELMAKELGENAAWAASQVAAFRTLAQNYLVQ